MRAAGGDRGRIGLGLAGLDLGLGGGHVLLQAFQGELELVGIEALGLWPVLPPEQLLDGQLQLLQLGRGRIQRRLGVAQDCLGLLQSASGIVKLGRGSLEIAAQ